MSIKTYIISLLTLSAIVTAAFGRSVKVRISPEMVFSEAPAGDPSMLFDEQSGPAYPPANAPGTVWHGGWKQEDYPIHAYIDLGTERQIITVYLYDTNGDGDFIVSYGKPGAWTELFTDNCKTYNAWKPHDVDVSTRYPAIHEDDRRRQHRRDRDRRTGVTRKKPLAGCRTCHSVTPVSRSVCCHWSTKSCVAATTTIIRSKKTPEGASRIETILGKPTRVLPNQGGAKYFAYRLGQGKNLLPGAAYVLTIEYTRGQAAKHVHRQSRR